jgi:hypothetical protein
MDQPFLFPEDSERTPPFYRLPEGRSINVYDLQKASPETQRAAMRQWFSENFEDPVNNTPYDSGEGGYQFIWGGPYDAREELEQEFGGIVPDEVIEGLADTLSDISIEWSGNSDKSEHFDDYLFDSISESSKHYEEFKSNILSVERLLEANVGAADYQCFLRVLYANVITILETYLSGKFISAIAADRKLLRKFIETTPYFRSVTIKLSEVFNASEDIEQHAKSYLADFVRHRFDRVRPMFRDTLGIEFPSDLKDLFGAIVVRHDLLHLNGKTKDVKSTPCLRIKFDY